MAAPSGSQGNASSLPYLSLQGPPSPGASLTLFVDDAESPPILADVVRVVQPSTMSFAIEVEYVAGDGARKSAILKLFDRRFASGMRAMHKMPEWSQEAEATYRRYVVNGQAEKAFADFDAGLDAHDDDSDDDDDDSHDDSNVGDNNMDDELGASADDECLLQHYSLVLRNTEVRAYKMLADLQGSGIPKLLATVRLPAPPPLVLPELYVPPDLSSQYLDVSGILIEYIPGFSLSHLGSRAPQEHWQGIVEDAIRTVDVVESYGLINRDVRPDNFIVKELAPEARYQVFQIDFAQVTFRDNTPWETWQAQKLFQDGPGAVASAMEGILESALVCRSSCGGSPAGTMGNTPTQDPEASETAGDARRGGGGCGGAEGGTVEAESAGRHTR